MPINSSVLRLRSQSMMKKSPSFCVHQKNVAIQFKCFHHLAVFGEKHIYISWSRGMSLPWLHHLRQTAYTIAHLYRRLVYQCPPWRPSTPGAPRAGSYYIVIMGIPKKVESLAKVAIVKLCSPLNHLVTSFGRLPIAVASCFLLSPRCSISNAILSEIANDMRVSSRNSGGISLKISWMLM